MRAHPAPFWFVVFTVAWVQWAHATPGPLPLARVTESFDLGWRFTVGDPAGAAGPEFADATWRFVNVPDDWSIRGPFDPKNPAGAAGAFLPTGVAWYRKSFTLPRAVAARRFTVEFDGVMQNSDVWINGQLLGHRPDGYVSFAYDLTPYLRFGSAPNVLAVRTDTSQQPASRWYAGGGIYRHVRLVNTDAVHLARDSAFIWSTPDPDARPGPGGPTARIVHVEAGVANDSPTARQVALRVTLIDPTGAAVTAVELEPQTIAPGATATFTRAFRLEHAALWEVATPNLYRARFVVQAAAETIDDQALTFGLRDAEFDSQRGFLLNGRPLKLFGVALHHDGGAFGAAVPLAVWEQRLTQLRTLGVNAIRTAHNPPDPAFLNLCDRLGFLVMDELFDCWTVGKNPYDYHLDFDAWSKRDVRDTVRRDRNHPSVVLYSAGNEIHDTPQEEKAKTILAGLVAVFHENDPTRPVTQALFRPNVSHDYTNGLADLLDVIGTNYRDQELLAAWRAKPGRKIIGTEQRHDRETWLALRDHPAEAGQFLWTGVDYLGEARSWPRIGNPSGLLDRTGTVKPIGWERQSWWTTQPMVAITRRIAPNEVSAYDPGYEPANLPSRRRQVLFRDWNPNRATAHDETVEVYSNCDQVELFLNGRSLGSEPLHADASPRVWIVPYAPGTVVAIARNHGREVARDELKTAGVPARVVLTADRDTVAASWDDVVRLVATVVDANGVPVPTATNIVTFKVDGPGLVVAVDNGDNATHEPFQQTKYPAYQGRCAAFVRATASVVGMTVRATAEGLESAEVRLQAR